MSARDAEILRLKAKVVRAIAKEKKRLGLTQESLARKLRISQPRVNEVLTEKYDLVSLDRLLALAISLKLKVNLTVE